MPVDQLDPNLIRPQASAGASENVFDAIDAIIAKVNEVIDEGGTGLVDGDYGDITVSGTGTAMAIDANAVTMAKLADATGASLLGAAGAGDPSYLTGAQATALLSTVTTAAKGLVPTAPNDATMYLDGTGAWSIPAGGGGGGSGTVGPGTVNRIAKFTAGTTVDDSQISDDGTDVSLTSLIAAKLNFGFGVAPAALAATPTETTDWNPWGAGTRYSLVRVTTATAGSILKSLAAGAQGDIVILENHGDGSGQYNNSPLKIRHNNTGASGITVGNNIYCPGLQDITLPYTASAILYCDGPLVGWIMIGTATGGHFERSILGDLSFLAGLSPAALASGSTNNYDPNTGGQFNEGQKTRSYLRLIADSAGSTLTGLVPYAHGTSVANPIRIIQNGGGPLTIAHESSSSTAGNRFALPSGMDLTLLSGQMAIFIYDTQGGGNLTEGRWRLVGVSPGTFATLTLNKHYTISTGATENDWEPSNWRLASVWRIVPAPTTMTGMKEVEAGAVRILTSYAAGLTIAHQSASSSARNRFYCPGAANFTLNAGDSATFRYDTDYGGWFCIGWTK